MSVVDLFVLVINKVSSININHYTSLRLPW